MLTLNLSDKTGSIATVLIRCERGMFLLCLRMMFHILIELFKPSVTSDKPSTSVPSTQIPMNWEIIVAAACRGVRNIWKPNDDHNDFVSFVVIMAIVLFH